MKLFRLAAILLVLQGSLGIAFAFQLPQQTAIGLGDVINAVEKPFRIDRSGSPELKTVRADFFQRSTIAAKQKEYRAEGEMYLRPATGSEPLKFHFEYFRPTRQEITCDGKTLWIYLPENKQVIQSDVAEFFDPARANHRAVNFLQGLGRISKDFTILFNRQMTDTAGNYVLELTPKRASVTIEKLFITVSRESLLGQEVKRPTAFVPPVRPLESRLFPILATTVVDHDGNSTTMEFSNVRPNSLISDMIFTFSPPADVQVVRPPPGR
jgi:outer membrane lipoprotein-sorting protein